MENNFIAVDVETANPDQSSICQIGLTWVENGLITKTESHYCNPECYFDEFNIEIHGISEETVADQIKLSNILEKIYNIFEGEVIVSHSSFDRIAFSKAFEKHNFDPPNCTWLDSMRVARRVWPEKFGKSGYGLNSIAKELKIEFEHHDAGEDSRVSAMIINRAILDTDADLNELLTISTKRNTHAQITKFDPNREGKHFGEKIVFTGTLSRTRKDAAKLASDAGFEVCNNVIKSLDYLVVGVQDISKLNGYNKSSKQRKTEELIKKGSTIKIVFEDDFWELLK